MAEVPFPPEVMPSPAPSIPRTGTAVPENYAVSAPGTQALAHQKNRYFLDLVLVAVGSKLVQ